MWPAIDGATQVVFSPDVANFGGWSHLHNGTFAGNGLDASGLLSNDLSVYDISDTSRVGEPDCGGDDTRRRTLVRRVEGHTNKHANGLQVRGTHPGLLVAESLIIDLRLEVDGTNIPTGIDAIHDGTAVLQVVADGDEVRILISPELYLGHWIRIRDGKIENYQCVVPTTWNASPRDDKGQIGAYEAALMNTPMAVPDQPVEILRTLHSFDPCLACSTHVMSEDGAELATVKVR